MVGVACKGASKSSYSETLGCLDTEYINTLFSDNKVTSLYMFLYSCSLWLARPVAAAVADKHWLLPVLRHHQR